MRILHHHTRLRHEHFAARAISANPASSHYHASGRLQIWRIDADRLSKVTEAPVGGWGQGIAWSKDARTLLVHCMIGSSIEVFAFDGRELRHTAKLDMPAGPAGIRTAEPWRIHQ